MIKKSLDFIAKARPFGQSFFFTGKELHAEVCFYSRFIVSADEISSIEFERDEIVIKLIKEDYDIVISEDGTEGRYSNYSVPSIFLKRIISNDADEDDLPF